MTILKQPLAGVKPEPSRDLALILAQRGSLARIVALVANERLVHIVYKPAEKLYYISPLANGASQKPTLDERFILAGSHPFQTLEVDSDGNLVPDLMQESNILVGPWLFQQKLGSHWVDVDRSVTADRFVNVLRDWMDWDTDLTASFMERIRCSAQYLADAYAENRPCPTRDSDYITWEQSIVEANGHPLHKSRMPVDPKTQPSSGFDFKHTEIAFMAVKRDILEIMGPLEAELKPLLAVAGIEETVVDSSEVVIPVHKFQIDFLLSRPEAAGKLRLLPQQVPALAQASTRSMTVPSLPGIAVKVALSLVIGDTPRILKTPLAYNAIRYWEGGMLDPKNVVGLQGPLEILPDVAYATGMGDHLGVMIRYDPYHSSRPPVDKDVAYAITGGLGEPAVIGKRGCVAESVFELSSLDKRLDFLREYTTLYLRCFLHPLFSNGLLIDGHGQNAVLRYSRSTGQLLGFSARDMSDARFNREHLERTTGIAVEERMNSHHMEVPDLMDRAFFIFFIAQLLPLIVALDLHRHRPASFTASELLWGLAGEKEASDLAQGNGWAVVARELHEVLRRYETMPGDDADSKASRELAAAARGVWFAPTWPLQCFVSQRMRADWAHRDKSDKLSHIAVSNVMISREN
ncbi:hypothetical protein DL766_009538 [Monosporascus sp. MC13-8B]|uniref:Aerobactin siderophore biosynthesis IucA/IucC N-terminal domain-containing protein n=1 Tax=Monosporascus cannonballus TaxID=155416 RepID=A0ABY0H2J5_9PEZI|nr:hypothetical protein DL763_009603 [Monosporascus cannonballus]RYO82790.1 hypothetical protein DL762_006454 [Monosporascus cannonballus]RYP14943.1 hypothetical protein DL766_009538 [Monosporascus sp. MC13-8B]